MKYAFKFFGFILDCALSKRRDDISGSGGLFVYPRSQTLKTNTSGGWHKSLLKYNSNVVY